MDEKGDSSHNRAIARIAEAVQSQARPYGGVAEPVDQGPGSRQPEPVHHASPHRLQSQL